MIQIHVLNDKQCRSISVNFLEANWPGSILFAKALYIQQGLIYDQEVYLKMLLIRSVDCVYTLSWYVVGDIVVIFQSNQIPQDTDQM